MVVTKGPWLIDKSALVRLGDSPDEEDWARQRTAPGTLNP